MYPMSWLSCFTCSWQEVMLMDNIYFGYSKKNAGSRAKQRHEYCWVLAASELPACH